MSGPLEEQCVEIQSVTSDSQNAVIWWLFPVTGPGKRHLAGDGFIVHTGPW